RSSATSRGRTTPRTPPIPAPTSRCRPRPRAAERGSAPQRMPFVSVVTQCFNEEENVDELCDRIRAQLESRPGYTYEHILIDNCSTDATVARVKAICAKDPRVKLIVNARNFGHIRSPLHAILQAT